MSKPLLIHQALHGYQEGHRLLTATRKLSSESQRMLLFLSDRSGPSLHPEFNRYLTGYPLADDTVYALSMTYDAPEMPRPGCVFTHTLLIEWADLSSIEDLRALTALLHKPVVTEGFDEYAVPIEQPLVNVPSAGWRSTWASALLDGIYAGPAAQVLLPADNAREYEELLLAVWSQQWPRLRRAWRFSTGTMSLRGALRKDFDLHVVPRPWARRMNQEAPRAHWLDLDGPAPHAEPPWIKLAVMDLAQVGRTDLQNFLLEHAADIEQGRTAFPILVDAYRASRNEVIGAPGAWIERLGTQFPKHDEAVRLKQTLLAPLIESVNSTAQREAELLISLATTQHWRAFDQIDLRAQDRFKRIWTKSRHAALDLTARLQSDRNPLGDALWRQCAYLITPDEAVALDERAPGTLGALLIQNIGIAAEQRVWQCPIEKQAGLLKQLADTLPLELSIQRAIYGAVLRYASDGLAEQACTQLGPAIIPFVLDAVEDENLPLSTQWRNALSARPHAIEAWLSSRNYIKPNTGVFLSDILDPQTASILEVTVPIWLALLTGGRDSLSPSQDAALCSFVLALGLQNAQGRGSELCQIAFPAVWHRVQDGHLSDSAWRRLTPFLPRRSYLDDVNWRFVRAEKLGRALVSAYLRWGWPLSGFLATLREPFVFEGVLDAVRKDEDADRLLHRLAVMIEVGQIDATETQSRRLKRLKWK